MAEDFIKLPNDDPSFPPLLKEISSPPKNIYLRGLLLNSAPHVAIVGTRKASKQSLNIAHDIASQLAGAGVVVVSGLAMGIDTAAHRGSLDRGGKTVAVLGVGIDKIYPAQNESLADEVLSTGGALVSEYEPGSPSYKGNFIQRNRIIAGLSLATIVIEAPERSGALTTARFAGEAGRMVFVVPGAATNSDYAGSHALIRDGATLVTSAQEILEDLGLDGMGEKPSLNLDEFGDDERAIMELMRREGKALRVDRIIELTTLDPQTVSSALATLTIWRVVEETKFGYELSHR